MVRQKYIPEQGDIVYFDFSPSAGHEQKGVRPAFVVSQAILNKASGLAVFAPITSKQKGYPFEVALVGGKTKGVVLSDQIRSVDFTARKVRYIETVDENIINEVKNKISALIS